MIRIIKMLIAIATLSLFIISCTLMSPPRFDTQEEIDAYVREHGMPRNRVAEREQRYKNEDNYNNVLSWAREGMTISDMEAKIGFTYTNMSLTSTYSSAGSIISVYEFKDVYVTGSGLGTVWLTFIDGKLDSITTIR